MRNAHWVLPFLYTCFKSSNTFTLSESAMVHALMQELETKADTAEDLEETKIEFGEQDESRARKYLLHWVQKRLLQDYPDAEGNTHYQLSAHTEKIFQWLQTLEQRQFVGTESRFKSLFQTLKELVEKTQGDAVKRLEELKNKKAEIEAEIQNLEYGQRPEVFSKTQVAERLQWFTRQGYELLGDFREVEDNFRQIHRSIVEQHTRVDINKGTIVGQAFAAYDALRQSDQGRSFYAFWDFSSPGKASSSGGSLPSNCCKHWENKKSQPIRTCCRISSLCSCARAELCMKPTIKWRKTQSHHNGKRNCPAAPLTSGVECH